MYSRSFAVVVLLLGLSLVLGCHRRQQKSATQPAAPPPPTATSSNGKGGKQGNFGTEKMTVAGKQREYRLVVPKSIDPDKPAPLVFAFHGLLDSKDTMPLYSRLDKLAEDKGFILVFPNGQNKAWPLFYELAKEDLAFFDGLYNHVCANYNVDLARVYLTGMSNGAYFTHLVGTYRSDKIAAIASHSGGPGQSNNAEHSLKYKYPVLVIHGDQDSVVNVKEGRLTRDMYQRWGHKVEYVELKGFNHFWATNEGINERIWTFFEDNPRRVP